MLYWYFIFIVCCCHDCFEVWIQLLNFKVPSVPTRVQSSFSFWDCQIEQIMTALTNNNNKEVHAVDEGERSSWIMLPFSCDSHVCNTTQLFPVYISSVCWLSLDRLKLRISWTEKGKILQVKLHHNNPAQQNFISWNHSYDCYLISASITRSPSYLHEGRFCIQFIV